MNTCQNCRHVKDVAKIDTPNGVIDNGWCYRFPPKIVDGNTMYVPVRPSAPACGEWRWRGVIAAFRAWMKG